MNHSGKKSGRTRKENSDWSISVDILKVLSPIWLTRPETARRIRQRLKTVFDWAKIKGYRHNGNPVEHIESALPHQPSRRGHFEAMPYDDVPDFVRTFRQCDASDNVKLGLEFLILTACGISEVLNVRWAEIDSDKTVWTIPAGRMKAGREHRVPLGVRALEILKAAKALSSAQGLLNHHKRILACQLECPLCPRKRTLYRSRRMSAKCHSRHWAPQQKAALFDQLVAA